MINKNFSSKFEELVFFTKLLQNCQNQIQTNDCDIQTFSIQNSDLKEYHSSNLNLESKSDKSLKETCLKENDLSNQNLESNNTDILQVQILKLQKSNKSLSLQNGRLEKTVVKVQNSKDLVIRNKSMRISNLERLFEKLQKEEEQQKEDVILSDDISGEFINNLIQNYGAFPSSRRYSNSIYDISYLLYLHSNITYKILRSIVPLTSEQMLREKLTVTKENLLNSYQINVLLGLILETYSYATLAYE